MASVTMGSGMYAQALETNWQLCLQAAGCCSHPREIEIDARWIAAQVPGTAAGALREAGDFRLGEPQQLHGNDIWYRTTISGRGRHRLRFDGLSTIAEVWLGDEPIARSENMFAPVECDVELSGEHELFIAFRSLKAHLAVTNGKRARWRTQLVDDAKLRFVRTTLLGHMPGWCPQVDCVGPWRPVQLIDCNRPFPDDLRIHSSFVGRERGCIEAEFAFPDEGSNPAQPVELRCNGQSVRFAMQGGRWRATLEMEGIRPWTVHTHGDPALYSVEIVMGENVFTVGKTGFRTIEADRGRDGRGFALRINGETIFARGVCWTPPDIVTLSCAEADYRREFELLREAGVNMVRVSGIIYYESEAFYRLAAEYGILVWQDAALANFDYPFAETDFAASLKNEVREFLRGVQMSPALAIFCGGSEVMQQAAMMGLADSVWNEPERWRMLEDIARAERPDIIFVDNSPSGGDLPFFVDAGVGHYYGAGAYLQPLEDARRAQVRFASECLAFSNVPEPASLETAGLANVSGGPVWKRGVPRDRDANWDFEDVRDHYVRALYGVEPAALRQCDPERYLALGRAATAEVMESVFGEWRTEGSVTAGGLVFLWKDVQQGAGWGVVDSSGRPKSAWYGLKRAFRPLQLVMSDEGVNGLRLHAINETAQAREVLVSLSCLRDGQTIAAQGSQKLTLPPRSTQSLAATTLLGGFFDAGYFYKFGPPAHDIVCCVMTDATTGEQLASAFHFPNGRGNARYETHLQARLERDGGGLSAIVSAARFAQSVNIQIDGYRPDDNYFHLPPGQERRIGLTAEGASGGSRKGCVSALNCVTTIKLSV
ncbi:MAG: glycoside hydrolase family 2 protein [Beijerinckiaceae bacterium]